MNDAENYEVPSELVESIISGNCVVFLGAGFSANTGKNWPELLNFLAGKTRDDRLVEDVKKLAHPGAPAADLMMCAQLIKSRYRESDESGSRWEEQLQNAVADIGTDTSRIDSLKAIPFKAIITTNFDGSLQGKELNTDLYTRLLREKSIWLQCKKAPVSPVFKIHGDANGNPKINPVIFASEDYRTKVHGEKNYGNFLRSVFATHTILFLGVSFTDEYLNELRSEVTSFSWNANRAPWAYAVLNDKPKLIREQLKKYDGLEILHYDTENGKTFSGFDSWLAAIENETSETAHLRSLLTKSDFKGNAVWVDDNPGWNDEGVNILKKSGVEDRIEQLDKPEDLDYEKHHQAPFILTEFGYDESSPDRPAAIRVLEEVNQWGERPPVIVFSEENSFVEDNRRKVLRHGAWEYTTQFRELFRVIETLLGRR